MPQVRRSRSARRSRGVYELEFSGPQGEKILFCVDHAGHLRRHIVAHGPEEVAVGTRVLWSHLDTVDPPGRILRAI